MTVDDLLLIVGEKNSLGKTLKQMPRLDQIKYLVTIRIMTALILEPIAELWNGLMDCREGKVTEVVQAGRQLEIRLA